MKSPNFAWHLVEMSATQEFRIRSRVTIRPKTKEVPRFSVGFLRLIGRSRLEMGKANEMARALQFERQKRFTVRDFNPGPYENSVLTGDGSGTDAQYFTYLLSKSGRSNQKTWLTRSIEE